MTLAKGFGFECYSSPQKRPRLFPYIDRGRGRRSLDSRRRLHRPLCADHGLRRGRAGRRRESDEGVLVTASSGRPARHRRRHRPRHGRLRILVNCAGIWAKRIGEMAGVALAAGVVEHQYFVTEKKLDLAADAHHVPRSRQEFLPEARCRRVRDRRLGGRDQGLLARAAAVRVRARAVSRPTWTGSSCSRCRRRSDCRS